MAKQIKIFDTLLRDGTQGEQISLSSEDKIRIAERFDEFGIHYVEGGWPGSNPKDFEFFQMAQKRSFKQTKIVAFGSTRRADRTVKNDPNTRALIESNTETICIFGKSWILHVKKALKIDPEENLKLIEDSIGYLKAHQKELIFDLEHYFDGYKDNPQYALKVLETAQKAGADVLVLCDTNGGTMTSDLAKIVHDSKKEVSVSLGIHTHNDCGLAVANSIVAVEEGCNHVQGTINGYGERCGNANLCSIIPNLQIKRGYRCIADNKLQQLTALSHFVSEIANVANPNNMPFVGRSAFAHKGGIHVSAMMKDNRTYEHILPEQVGNSRRVLVSDLSGRSNIFYKAEELKIDIEKHKDRVQQIVKKIKDLENQGYQYEAAEGSFEVMVERILGELEHFFDLEGFRILVEKNKDEESRSEATIRLKVNNVQEHMASEGDGPVHALDQALRKALIQFYPEVEEMQLSDYKVRVLNAKDGTAARVRVLIESCTDSMIWNTVGVSEDIIEASWQALTDSFIFFLMKKKRKKKSKKINNKK
jgi:2-isopropylmalate synthase